MNTSRQWLLDLLHSIGEKLALCDHLAEKLDRPEVQKLYAKVLNERRNEMRVLANYGTNTNLEYWCELKHALKSWVLAQECYDSQPTAENLNVAQYSSDILAGTLSLFLGIKFEDCGRCLNDRLMFEYNENSKERSKDGRDKR